MTHVKGHPAAPRRRALLGCALGLVVGCADPTPAPESGGGDDPTLGAVQVETLQKRGWGDYALTTWELGQTLDPPLVTKDGGVPRAHLFGPADPPPGPPRPTLLWLHGGSLDFDDEEYPEGRLGYCGDEHAERSMRDALGSSPLLVLAAMRGWVLVLPENTVCDGWAGMAALDPVDTTHHGAVLARAAMALGQSGQLPWEPGPRYVAGTSLGAPAAVELALSGEYAGLVVDSGSSDELCFFADESCSPLALLIRRAWGLHVFGGLPYELDDSAMPAEHQDRYLRRSLVPMLTSGEITSPVMHLWSSDDKTSIPAQHEGVEEALAASSPGGRWLNVDMNTSAHSFLHRAPAPGAAWMTLRFLEGAQVSRYELEDYEGEGWVGEVQERGVDRPDASGSAVRRAIADDGAGTLVVVEGLPDCPAGLPLEWMLLLRSGGGERDGAVAAKATISQGGEERWSHNFTVKDLSGSTSEYAALRRWLEVSSGGLISQGGEGRLELEVTGEGEVRADVLYWSCG